MRPSIERLRDCVEGMDVAWSEGEKCYLPDAGGIDSRFSVAVRYAHIFLRTRPQLSKHQNVVPRSEIERALSKLEAAWKPEKPDAAQGDQRGRYDDALADEDVRSIHVALRGLLEAAIAKEKGK